MDAKTISVLGGMRTQLNESISRRRQRRYDNTLSVGSDVIEGYDDLVSSLQEENRRLRATLDNLAEDVVEAEDELADAVEDVIAVAEDAVDSQVESEVAQEAAVELAQTAMDAADGGCDCGEEDCDCEEEECGCGEEDCDCDEYEEDVLSDFDEDDQLIIEALVNEMEAQDELDEEESNDRNEIVEGKCGGMKKSRKRERVLRKRRSERQDEDTAYPVEADLVGFIRGMVDAVIEATDISESKAKKVLQAAIDSLVDEGIMDGIPEAGDPNIPVWMAQAASVGLTSLAIGLAESV